MVFPISNQALEFGVIDLIRHEQSSGDVRVLNASESITQSGISEVVLVESGPAWVANGWSGVPACARGQSP